MEAGSILDGKIKGYNVVDKSLNLSPILLHKLPYFAVVWKGRAEEEC